MGRVRAIGIKAATVTAVSAAVLATITAPASAAGVGSAIEVCPRTGKAGQFQIEGRNQHNKKVTSPTGFYTSGNGCLKLKNWWWIAPGVDVFYRNDGGSLQVKSKALSKNDYNKWITVYLD